MMVAVADMATWTMMSHIKSYFAESQQEQPHITAAMVARVAMVAVEAAAAAASVAAVAAVMVDTQRHG